MDTACSSPNPPTREQCNVRVGGRPPTSRWLPTPTREFLSLVLDPSSGQASWGVYGGTSLSTQLFGGLIAVADQGRALAGLGTLDGATQTLPLLYSVSSADFRDVTIGSNGHRATAGYDLVTGRGSPRGTCLVSDLSNPNIQAAIPKRAVQNQGQSVGQGPGQAQESAIRRCTRRSTASA